MNTATTTLPVPEATPEVLAFAREKGIERELAAMLAATRSVFPAQTIRTWVYQDPELAYNQEIVFDIPFPGHSAEECLEVRDRWLVATAPAVPPTHYHWFGLVLSESP
jgi:hypothetical protein